MDMGRENNTSWMALAQRLDSGREPGTGRYRRAAGAEFVGSQVDPEVRS
jgi:hypothetical protein